MEKERVRETTTGPETGTWEIGEGMLDEVEESLSKEGLCTYISMKGSGLEQANFLGEAKTEKRKHKARAYYDSN